MTVTAHSAFWSSRQECADILQDLVELEYRLDRQIEPPRITHIDALRQEIRELSLVKQRVPTVVNLCAQGMLTGVWLMGIGCWAFTPMPLGPILAVCGFASYFILSLWGSIRLWLRYL